MGAIEYCKIIVAAFFETMLFGNSACNAVCFIAFVINQLKLNGLTSGLSCPKVFALSARIMDDYLVCTIQYRFCRTIVLFKTNNLCGLKVLLKFKNIADIRANRKCFDRRRPLRKYFDALCK